MITKTFGHTGAPQLWRTPTNIDVATGVRVQLKGASAGPLPAVFLGGATGYAGGGDGGLVEGDFTPTPGENCYIYVGGAGRFAGPAAGGFNGGGSTVTTFPAASGGGATDLRRTSTGTASRSAVAAGGGGWGTGPAHTAGGSSCGGAATGQDGLDSGSTTGGLGGGTSGGGTGGGAGLGAGANGTSGQGGAGAANGNQPGPGGGGGYYGGGAGGGAFGTGPSSDAGGGSNYVGGLSGVVVNERGTGAQSRRVAAGPGGTPVGADGSAWITYNLVPNAPTPVSPGNGSNVDATVDLAARWTFSDDDPLDSQTAYELRYAANGGAWVTTGKVTSSTDTATIAAGTFTAGDSVQWQVRTWDLSDAAGPWSASQFATACNPPSTAFVFDPARTSIDSRRPVVTGHRSDTTVIAQWQVQATDSAGTVVLADSGVVTAAPGATSLTQQLPDFGYTNGGTYHLRAKIAYPAGVWQHAWTDSGPLTADIQPPAAPLVWLTQLDTDPVTDAPCLAVQVDWSSPTPTDPALTVDHVDVYRTEGAGPEVRIAAGLPADGSYTDRTVGFHSSGLDVNYRAVAVTVTGAYTSSA